MCHRLDCLCHIAVRVYVCVAPFNPGVFQVYCMLAAECVAAVSRPALKSIQGDHHLCVQTKQQVYLFLGNNLL